MRLTGSNNSLVLAPVSYTHLAIIWPLSTGSADSRLADNSESVIRLYTSRELLTAREPVGDWSTVYFGGSGISVWVRVH